MGVDETLERRRGKKISAKGIYRDPVRSSASTSSKRAPQVGMPDAFDAGAWASRVWSLPFLSALAYSERYAKSRASATDAPEWAWQLLLLVRRWYPEREIVAVADGGYASLKLLDRCGGLQSPSPSSPVLGWTRPSTNGSATIPRSDRKNPPQR